MQARIAGQKVEAGLDQLALARIARMRRIEAERITRDRDYVRLYLEMDRLDAEKWAARAATHATVSARVR